MRDLDVCVLGRGIVWFVHPAGARECVRRLRYDGIVAEYVGERTPPAVRRQRLAEYERDRVDWLVLTYDAAPSPALRRADIAIFAELPAPPQDPGRAMERARRSACPAREIFMIFRHWSDAHVARALDNRAPRP